MHRREWAGVHSAALVATLYLTLPTSGQVRTVNPNPQNPGDTVLVECVGGSVIHELQAAYLWGQFVPGGAFAVVDSHSVVGREGQLDSFQVTASGSYFVTTRNTVGQSCAPTSPVQVVLDVEPGPTDTSGPDPVVSWSLFSPSGARVREFRASGIYFVKIVRRSGHVEQRKVPFVRGVGPLVQVHDWYPSKTSQ